MRRGMPCWCSLFGQHSHMEGGGVDQPDFLLFGEGSQIYIHVINQKIVAAITKQGVSRRGFRYLHQYFQRITTNANETNFTLFLKLAHGWNSFVDDLIEFSELHVMDMKQVDIVGLQPLE